MVRQRRGSAAAAAAAEPSPPEDEPMDTNDAENGIEEDGEEEEEEGGIRIGDIYLPPPPPPACTFESNGPRLVITHIENENFKSYLGKQVLGPFHKVRVCFDDIPSFKVGYCLVRSTTNYEA